MVKFKSARVAPVVIAALLGSSALGVALAQAPAAPPAQGGAAGRGAAPAQAQAPQRGAPNLDATYNKVVAERTAKLDKLSAVTDAMLKAPPSGDWLSWRGGLSNQSYSAQSQINKANVANLKEAWSWSLPVSPNEITPIVHEGVIFVASANRVQAIDGATGDLLWQYTRQLPPALNGGAQGVVKNLGIYGDKVFFPTPDAHMVALEMKTGKVVWDHKVAADGANDSLKGGPIVVHGKVIQGTTCRGAGGCFIFALDANTGDEVWRFNTIARPGQPGGDSWNGAPVNERFGGSVWTSPSYDPDLNLIYSGIGQTYTSATLLKPHAQPGESADALYTDATVALNPDTGKLVWHYQHFNRDVWDFDWVFERTLIDLPVDGKMRKVSLTGGKLAIFDAVDRATGEYLFSKDLGLQTLVTSIDPKTGKKIYDPKLEPKFDTPETICPHAGGARSWPTTAYNPTTHILYVPLVESCMTFTRTTRTPEQTATGTGDIGWILKPRSDSDGNFGRVMAIDLVSKKVVWTQRRRAPEVASTLVTAGGLVFDGSRDRVFRASDDMTGKTLWQVRLPAVPSSSPIVYTVNGEQYIAVVAGGGGAHEATWPTLTPEIDNPAGATSLHVFKLPKAAAAAAKPAAKKAG